MRKIIYIICLLFSWVSVAAELEEGKVYRLHKTVYGIELARSAGLPVVVVVPAVVVPPAGVVPPVGVIPPVAGPSYIAVMDSKFKVIDATSSDHYVVRFITLYNHTSSGSTEILSTVNTHEEYILKKTINTVPISKSSSLSRGGAVSGPLIVPFKYRTDDKSLTGDAAVGYYVGYSIEPRIPWTDTRIPITPFIAGGLSQVSVSNGEDTTNQTGITFATGILIQNWAGVNIGIVYGQDRIGDQNWKHEGKGWVSFMVGWEL